MPKNHTHNKQSMATIPTLLTVLLLPILINAETCTDGFLTEAQNMNLTHNCMRLTMGTEFAWKFDNKTRHLQIAFGARLDGDARWLAWGLNPAGPHMVGTRALIGIREHGGLPVWRKFSITEETKRGCGLAPSEDIGIDVRNFRFVYLEGIRYFVIQAMIVLPEEYNSSETHIIWQIGGPEIHGVPVMHPMSLENLDSAETLDLNTGLVISYGPDDRRQLRMAHGILNIAGWGTLLPIGVMIARYTRRYPIKFDWWLVFHVSCQSAGYALGSAGWVLGFWLGNASKYYTFSTHRILAVIIFTFTTVQMMALRLTPKRRDRYRKYWSAYHHILGYALLTVIAANIFEGIRILEADRKWKWAYIGLLGVLGAIAAAFEVVNVIKVLRDWKAKAGAKAKVKTKAEAKAKAKEEAEAKAKAEAESQQEQKQKSGDQNVPKIAGSQASSCGSEPKLEA